MHGGFRELLDCDLDHERAPGLLTIDLGALRANYRTLVDRLSPTRVAAVVKADAYGLGATQVVQALFECECRDFFVAHMQEAQEIKRILSGDARVFVLNGLSPGTECNCARAGIIPVLNSLDQISAWSSTALGLEQELPACLQVDTGMSRLGLSETEFRGLIAEPSRLRGVALRFLMSHLASADRPGGVENDAQLSMLHEYARHFPSVGVSLANSGGIFLGQEFYGMLARPGIALYGGEPAPGMSNPMQPVVQLSVRVIQTRDVSAGTPIGYGGTFVAPNQMRLATIAAGYADGVPFSLSNRGAAYFGAIRLPIVGQVSMDTTILDVSCLPPAALKPGSMVEIIGPHQTLQDVAADSGTISYEILTRLGRRFWRQYR